MKKTLILISLFVLAFSDSTSDICTTNFNNKLQSECSKLSDTSDSATTKCSYSFSENKCESVFIGCSSYTPTSDNDSKCTSIELDDKTKKCVIKGTGNSRTCAEEDKTCEDHNSDDNCVDLKAETGQRCVLFKNQCKAHYNECSSLSKDVCDTNIPSDHLKKCQWSTTNNACEEVNRECEDEEITFSEVGSINYSTNCLLFNVGEGKRCVKINNECKAYYENCESISTETECKANLYPKGNNKKCVWSSDSCSTGDRNCGEYITFSDKYDSTENSKPCSDLKPVNSDSTKYDICYLDGNTCTPYYSSCSIGNNDENLCKTIKTFSDSFYTSFNPYTKCAYKDTTCSVETKGCSEYTSGLDCYRFQPTNSNYQTCDLDSSKNCVEKYQSCEHYNDAVNEDERSKDICENADKVKNDDYHYCSFEEKKCTTKRKPCSQIKDKDICNNQIFEDATTKRCLWYNNNCVETYQTCEDYSGSDITKENCELIQPTYTDGTIYNCTIKEESGTKTCIKNIIECDYYKENIEGISCSDITVNLEDYKDYKCELNGNICAKKERQCNVYKGKDSAICKAIIPESTDSYKKKCELKSEVCTEVDKTCEEYTGDDWEECHNLKGSKVDTSCYLNKENKCLEEFNPDYYSSCSDYKNKNKEECESIYPTQPDSYYVTYKCVYDSSSACKQEEIKCSDAEDESDCEDIALLDEKKQCLFVNNKCQEFYKTCKLYNDNSETINEQICKAIIINDPTNSENYLTHYCDYTAPTGSETKGKCESKKRSCENFDPENIKSQCTSQSPYDYYTKKCVYDNKKCSTQSRNCLDIYGGVSDLEDACKNAPTSASNKVCKVNGDSDGCEEVENTNNKPNSAKNNYLSKIIFGLLFCLMM